MGYRVYATYLPSGEIAELEQLAQNNSNIVLIPMDITKEREIESVAQKLKSESIDIVINNAGILGEQQDLEHITAETMLKVYLVNAIGPLLVAKHFIDNISRSSLKTLVTISSRRGSISYMLQAYLQLEPTYAYSASKAALNMIMSRVASDTYNLGVKVLLFHPGHVKTAMGGQHAEIDTGTSVSGMINVIETAQRSLENFYYNYDGTKLNW